jgi:hypothetical protein
VTADPALRRLLRRSLHATGSVVEFVNEPAEVLALVDPKADLIVIDETTKQHEKVEQLLSEIDARFIVLGHGLEQAESLRLLRAERCDNLIGRTEDVDEDEVVITTIKLLTGDIFGVEKYLTWGVNIHCREVLGYDGKREAGAS